MNTAKRSQLLHYLNSESNDLIIMTEPTLMKHIDQIIERKFEQDER
jgi:hypothetical protein